MKKQNDSPLKRVAREIRQEAARQLRGFPKDDLRQQLVGGWGREFAHQLFGSSRRSRYRSHSR